jgi:hypothetical protein
MRNAQRPQPPDKPFIVAANGIKPAALKNGQRGFHTFPIRRLNTGYLLLPTKVGSPLSIPSLAGDLKASYNSVRSWLDIFERLLPDLRRCNVDGPHRPGHPEREEHLSLGLHTDTGPGSTF